MQQHQSIKHFTRCALAVATLSLAGCGAWQATKDGTVDAAQWVFTTQVKTMNIDLDARAALNETTNGQPLSTVVRIYQLKDAQTFAQLEYTQLQHNDLELLKADVVATKDVIMRPGSSASVSEPMNKDTQYVGIAAFFRSPSSDGVWKILIPKKQWKDTDPVKVRVQGNLLAYDGSKEPPVTHDAPQQSTTTAKPQSNAPVSSDASAKSAAATSGATGPQINPNAALGNSADTLRPAAPLLGQAQPAATTSTGSVSSSTSIPKVSGASKVAAPSISSATDSVNSARATANSLSRGAASLLSH
jgi:type VI secretion system protein VasD